MSTVLKYLAILLFVALFGAWFVQVFKSCNAQKAASDLTESVNSAKDNASDLVSDLVEDEDGDPDLEDLYDEEEDMDEILAEAEKDEDLLDEDEGDVYEDEDLAEDTDEEDDQPEATLASTDTDNDENQPTSSYSDRSADASAKYLVVAGAFISKGGAERTMNKLVRMGYDDAEVVAFDYSEYHSVCVDRFYDESTAAKMARELKKKGIEAYVHKKRKFKKRS